MPFAGLTYVVFKETSPVKKIGAKIKNTKLSRFVEALENNFINKAKSMPPDLLVNLDKIKRNIIPVSAASLFIIGQIVNKNDEIAQLEANISDQNRAIEDERSKYRAVVKKIKLLEEKPERFFSKANEVTTENKEILKLKNELSSRKNDIAQIRSNVKIEASEKYKCQEAEIERLTELNNNKANEIAALISNADQHNLEIGELTGENERLTTELAEVKSQFAHLKVKDEEQHEKIQGLENKKNRKKRKK